MRELIVNMEEILTNSVLVLTMLMEVFGVCVLVYTAVKCFIKWLRKADNMRLELAEGIALALRGLLTFLIHWEIKNEQKAAMEKLKT